MYTPPLLNQKALTAVFIALVINVGLLFFAGKRVEVATHIRSVDLAYNLYKKGEFRTNAQRMAVAFPDKYDGRLPSYVEVNEQKLNQDAHEKWPSFASIGHSVLIALIWWATDSLDLYGLLVLQVFMYILLVLLLFQITFMLFESEQIASYCTFAHLVFIPLIRLNINLIPDIWAYYAIIIFLYGYLRFLTNRSGIHLLFVTSVLAALFQHVRPSVFLQIVTLALLMLAAPLLTTITLRKALVGVGVILISNAAFFWTPFMSFNKNYYGRYFVGPTGQALMEGGLGEYQDNPWGFRQNDQWFKDYMKEHYGLKHGTPECDDKAKEIFWQRVWEHPWFYFSTIIDRFRVCLRPQFSEDFVPIVSTTFRQRLARWLDLDGLSEKMKGFLKLAPSQWIISATYRLFFEYFMYFLFYLGIFLALKKHYYFQTAVLIIGVILPTFFVILSHIEFRYLVPFYWPVPIFSAYFLWHAKEYYLKHGFSLSKIRDI